MGALASLGFSPAGNNDHLHIDVFSALWACLNVAEFVDVLSLPRSDASQIYSAVAC